MGASDALSRDFAHVLNPALFRTIGSFDIIKDLSRVCDPLSLMEAELECYHEALQRMFQLF